MTTTHPELSSLFTPLYLGTDPKVRALLDSVSEIEKWVRRLRFMADHVQRALWPQLLRLMGGRRPYVFERNVSRWPDGLHHLVDRGYGPFAGIAFDRATLGELGIMAWDSSPACRVQFAEGCIALMDDEFTNGGASLAELYEVARLLEVVAKRARPA